MLYSGLEIEEALKRRDMSELTNMINDGMDVNSLVVKKHTDVLLAAINKKHKSLFKLVLSKGFKCNQNGFNYFHHAIRTNDMFFIDEILKNYKSIGLNYNEYNSDKENSLHIAASELDMPNSVFNYLTMNGISWEDKNINGQTPLHILLRKKLVINKDLFLILKEQKKAFQIKDDFGISPIDIILSFSTSKLWLNKNKFVYEFIQKLKEKEKEINGIK